MIAAPVGGIAETTRAIQERVDEIRYALPSVQDVTLRGYLEQALAGRIAGLDRALVQEVEEADGSDPALMRLRAAWLVWAESYIRLLGLLRDRLPATSSLEAAAPR